MKTLITFYICTIFLLLSSLRPLSAMAQNRAGDMKTLTSPEPTFEVASIRLADRNDGRQWFGMRLDASGRYQASAVSLESLVSAAYCGAPDAVKVATHAAVPKWVSSDEFDIQAKIDDAYLIGWSKLSDEQRMNEIRPMLRRLLSERFRVKLEVELQMTPVYALVQAKGGAHVKEVLPPPLVDGDATVAESRWMANNPGKVFPGEIMCSGGNCTGHAVKISLAVGQIAANSRADRMVIDQTGLMGYYDLSFRFPLGTDEFPMQEVGDDLGMKFESRSVPIKTYIIRSAEKPSVD